MEYMADREVPESCRADYYGGAVLALTAAEDVPGTAGVNTTVVLYNALRDVYAARQPACTPGLRPLEEATLAVISHMDK